MTIDDARLIHGLIRNLNELAALVPDPGAQALLKSSQTMALALSRRMDGPAAARRFAEGRRLLLDAAVTLGAADPERCERLRRLLTELPEELPPRLDATARGECFELIQRGIWVVFDGSKYPSVGDDSLKGLMTRLSQWERLGYALRNPEVPEVPEYEKLVVVDADRLQTYLRTYRSGYEDAVVTDFSAVAGGFSKQTALFDVATARGREKLVYRGATKIQIIDRVLVDIAAEFKVVSYAFASGVPVAEPLWLQSDSGATGTRFFVSRRVPGINLGTAVQAHAEVSPAATQALAEALASIHSLPLDADGPALEESHIRHPAQVSLAAVIRRRVADWARYFRSLNTGVYPTLELAFQWLLDNASASDGDAPVLVHGDYGLHNILVHEDRVSAVLDWEACHVGDRALDLSHILAGTAGKMDPELFMRAYVNAGGRAVSPFRLKYYQVLMSMQFMLSTIDAQHIFQHRAAAGTNYCTLGLGFMEFTANGIFNGILQAGAARGDP